MQMDLLWTNPYASNFPAGVVNANCGNYDYVIVIFRMTAGSTTFISSTALLNTNNIVQGGWEFKEIRSFDVNPSNVYFYSGYIYFSYGGGATQRDDRLIPYKIIGVKGL